MISIALGLADLIRYLKKRTPPHPAISLTFDFISFGGLLSMAIIEVIVFAYVYDGEECQNGFDTVDCRQTIARLRSMEWTGVAMMFLGALAHLVLFVKACRDVHYLRKETDRRKKEAGRRSSWIELK